MFKYMIGDTVCTKGSERIGTIVSLQHESITSDFNSYEVEFRQLPVRAGGEESFTLTLYEKDLSLYNNKKEVENDTIESLSYNYALGDKVIVVNSDKSYLNGAVGTIIKYLEQNANQDLNLYLVEFKLNLDGKDFIEKLLLYEKELEPYENVDKDDIVDGITDDTIFNAGLGAYKVKQTTGLNLSDVASTKDPVEVEETTDPVEVEPEVEKAISEMKNSYSPPQSKFEVGEKVLFTDKTLNDHGMEDGNDTVLVSIQGKAYDNELKDWVYWCKVEETNKLERDYFTCRETTSSDDIYLSPLPIKQKIYYIVDLDKRSIANYNLSKNILENYKKENDKLYNLSEIREVEVELWLTQKY